MIICPNCKEEIDDNSHFCDQCGQALLYCERCGRVGMGRRCTSCGSMMLSAGDFLDRPGNGGNMSVSASVSVRQVSQRSFATSSRGGVATSTRGAITTSSRGGVMGGVMQPGATMPQLMLFNDSLGIRIMGINGAVIGRKQGPYVQFFRQQGYVSGVHAQLLYRQDTGWNIVDKGSSNGTKLNDHRLQPEVEMSIKNGDLVSIANIVLQVIIN